ncbi:SRPBCC domain-containing protein [Kitasatospora sp. NPDC058115]|uniref:SRPBCC domain-containing protein n=1 Tax=Kitasatospora sp. NPDC058115 TaxID=3346347 RepID=UPI0036D79CBA
MVADSIQREITIAAPRERVWEELTRPEFLGAWLGGAHGPVERVEPPAVLAFRRPWGDGGRSPADGAPAPAAVTSALTSAATTLVTLTLTTEPGDHTRLRMTESGFTAPGFPGKAARAGTDRSGTGWTRRLTDLACHTERLTLRR